MAELLALAKTGKTLSFASAGNGTPQHLAGELFNSMEQVKLGHVPYRGAGPALNDLIGGQVGVMFDIVGSSLQHIQGGRLIPLAVTSPSAARCCPTCPPWPRPACPATRSRAGHGIAVRAGTPPAAIDKLNATVNAIFKDPAFRTRWEATGTPAVGGTAAEFGALIKSDSQRLGALVRSTGVDAGLSAPRQ